MQSDGDLRNWEYLTQTYDQEDIFDHHSKSDHNPPLPLDRRSSVGEAIFDPLTGQASSASLMMHSNYRRPASSFVGNVVIDTTTNVTCTQHKLSNGDRGYTAEINDVVSHNIFPNQETKHHLFLGETKEHGTGSHLCGLNDRLLASTTDASIAQAAELEPFPIVWSSHESHATRHQQPVRYLEPKSSATGDTSNVDMTRLCVSDFFKLRKQQRKQPTAISMSHVRRNAIESNDSFTSENDELHHLSSRTVQRLTTGHPRIEQMCLPMSAYNYFYRDESANIVQGMTSPTDPLPSPIRDFTLERHERLLHQHWYLDPFKKKRRHRKTHGVIDFPTLSQAITTRWKSLSPEGRDFYRRIAAADQDQYDLYKSPQSRQIPTCSSLLLLPPPPSSADDRLSAAASQTEDTPE